VFHRRAHVGFESRNGERSRKKRGRDFPPSKEDSRAGWGCVWDQEDEWGGVEI
jgi:hypothetical protein